MAGFVPALPLGVFVALVLSSFFLGSALLFAILSFVWAWLEGCTALQRSFFYLSVACLSVGGLFVTIALEVYYV